MKWVDTCAGMSSEQPALLQFSVTNTVLANGLGSSPAGVQPLGLGSGSANGPQMAAGLPPVGGLALPSLAGVAANGTGAHLICQDIG